MSGLELKHWGLRLDLASGSGAGSGVRASEFRLMGFRGLGFKGNGVQGLGGSRGGNSM